MERNVSITEARRKLNALIVEAELKGNSAVINRNGKPAAVVVPLYVYENWKRQRNELFDIIRKIQEENEDIDPEEAMQLAIEAQQAVRAQKKSSPHP